MQQQPSPSCTREAVPVDNIATQDQWDRVFYSRKAKFLYKGVKLENASGARVIFSVLLTFREAYHEDMQINIQFLMTFLVLKRFIKTCPRANSPSLSHTRVYRLPSWCGLQPVRSSTTLKMKVGRRLYESADLWMKPLCSRMCAVFRWILEHLCVFLSITALL